MAPRKLKTPAVRPESHDSDSDEAPEIVTKQSATQQAQEQRQQEHEARVQAKAAKSRKRKSKQEVQEQSGAVPELSDEILSAVAAREEEEEAVNEEEAAEQRRADKRRAKKQAKLMQKKTHTRQFGNIQVQTLEALEKTQTRELTDGAKEFVERRTAPKRERMDLMKGHPAHFCKKQRA
ncbi:hypothetical protein PRIC1_012288 [Phytophthora ramorum]